MILSNWSETNSDFLKPWRRTASLCTLPWWGPWRRPAWCRRGCRPCRTTAPSWAAACAAATSRGVSTRADWKSQVSVAIILRFATCTTGWGWWLVTGLGWLWFWCSTIIPNRPADSAKFPSARAELGRQWNVKIQSQPNPVTNHHSHHVHTSGTSGTANSNLFLLRIFFVSWRFYFHLVMGGNNYLH